MSMSDCIRCWETPCVCGWEYRNYTRNRRTDLAAAILGVEVELLEKQLGIDIPDKHPMYERDDAQKE